MSEALVQIERMGGKPVYRVPAKSVINFKSGFGHKLLCDSLTFSAGSACQYSCTFCVTGETRIQMANGSTKPIRDVQPGDKIIGIREAPKGEWFKYVEGEVIAKATNIKPAFRITTGLTEVISSGDHRWLSTRGWKYTQGAIHGSSRRPHLTTNNYIRALGPALSRLENTQDYMRGYLSGIIKGDGLLGRYDYSGQYRRKGQPRPQRTDVQHHFRLALTDFEAVDRAAEFLKVFGVPVHRVPFASSGSPMVAIRNNSRTAFETVTALIQPLHSSEWLRGWLAGIFDAEGNDSTRIANCDEEILATTERAESHFGFDHTRDIEQSNGRNNVRFRGGLSEMTRFFQLTQPTIARKWGIVDSAVRGSSKVESIEPLNQEMEMFDIQTTCETFIANGLISHNCYVTDLMRKSPHLKSVRDQHNEKFPSEPVPAHSEIVIRREGVLGALKSQLSPYGRPRFTDPADTRVIYMSPLVDVAANLELCDETVEACKIILGRTNWQIRMLSKSSFLPRIARRLDAEPSLRAKERIIYGVSTGTLDNKLAACFEKGTALVSRRIESLHWLQDNGFRTFGMICPSLPMPADEYSEFAAQMCEAIRVDKCEHVWAEVMNVRGDSFTRTETALRDAGYIRYAALLQMAAEDKAYWEEYSRETFLAHAKFIPGRKLRFLQYVNKSNRPWWEMQTSKGAVLL